MDLRHDDEPLTRQEARAFLLVHAEREARAAQGTRVAELAESLKLSPDEARSILAEARTRAASRAAYAPLALALLVGVGVVLAVFFALYRPAANLGPPQSVAPLMRVASPETSASLQAGTEPVNVPAGFEIAISVPGATTRASGPPAALGTDFRAIGEAGAAGVRSQLVEASLVLLDNALTDSGAWMRARELSVYLRVSGGGWTLVKVPLKPFTLPLQGNPGGRASLKATLGALYEAGWADVVRASPR